MFYDMKETLITMFRSARLQHRMALRCFGRKQLANYEMKH